MKNNNIDELYNYYMTLHVYAYLNYYLWKEKIKKLFIQTFINIEKWLIKFN